MTLGDTETTMRQRRQLADTAIAQATQGEWEAAVATNQELLELGPDTDAYNRLGKAFAELGRHDEALAAYENALERDATNRIAERNVARLRVLLGGGDGTRRQRQAGEGIGRRFHRGDGQDRPCPRHQRRARRASWRRSRRATRSSWRSTATRWWRASARCRSARSSRASGARLGKLMKGGNRYDAAITVVERRRGADHHPRDVRPPRQLRQGLASRAARPAGRLASDPTFGAAHSATMTKGRRARSSRRNRRRSRSSTPASRSSRPSPSSKRSCSRNRRRPDGRGPTEASRPRRPSSSPPRPGAPGAVLPLAGR